MNLDRIDESRWTLGGCANKQQERRRAGFIRKRLQPLAFAFLLASTAIAAAQTVDSSVEMATAPLPPEKQAIIKQHVRNTKVPSAEIEGDVRAGMTVPDAVELWALPQDSVTEVPTVTSYKFFMSGNVIAVVNPENRKVIQVIRQ